MCRTLVPVVSCVSAVEVSVFFVLVFTLGPVNNVVGQYDPFEVIPHRGHREKLFMMWVTKRLHSRFSHDVVRSMYASANIV